MFKESQRVTACVISTEVIPLPTPRAVSRFLCWLQQGTTEIAYLQSHLQIQLPQSSSAADLHFSLWMTDWVSLRMIKTLLYFGGVSSWITSAFPLISYPHHSCTKCPLLTREDSQVCKPQTASLSCVMTPLKKCRTHWDSGDGSSLFSVTLCYVNHIYDSHEGNHDVCQPGCALSRAAQSQVTWWRYAFCLIISSGYGSV